MTKNEAEKLVLYLSNMMSEEDAFFLEIQTSNEGKPSSHTFQTVNFIDMNEFSSEVFH